MSEIAWVGISMGKFLILTLVAGLYSAGGSNYNELKKLKFIPEPLCEHPKAIRRYIAPTLLILSICGFNLAVGRFSYWHLLCLPLLMGAWCLPYGANRLWKKITLRSIFAIASIIAGIPLLLGNPLTRWGLFAMQCVTALCGSVILGVTNDTEEASTEQFLICICLIWGVAFYV